MYTNTMQHHNIYQQYIHLPQLELQGSYQLYQET